jgi:hypothetical protein
MNGTSRLAVFLLAFLAITHPGVANSQVPAAPQAAAQAHGTREDASRGKDGTPQDFVVCTGWHALCTESLDCQVSGDKANCPCARVNENHIVATAEIQDTEAKRRTLDRCTTGHPCQVDEAPVCKAIQSGRYEVDHARYDWVSTYSYRGWCSILQKGFKACEPQAPGYTGDRSWAICDAAPCTENPDPSNPEKPLSCQCRVQQSAFVGLDGCSGLNGGIMSSFPASAWDFQRNTYPFAMPGYEYVQGACNALRSDPLPHAQEGGSGEGNRR